VLKGRTALVTGSTSGIGLACIRALAGAGADVILNGLGEAGEVEKLCSAIEKEFGVRATYDPANALDPAALGAMIAAAERDGGGLDILVNNVGIQHTAPIEEFPAEKWDAIIGINLSSAFHTIRHAVRPMKARGWGRIVNIASAHGLVASAEKAAYVAAKHGILGLTKVVALETAGTGVTCNAVCPGWVRTELVERQIEARAEAGGVSVEDAAQALVSEKMPSGQFVTPAQIGATVVFLCSEAATQITGVPITVDGGWTAQ